MVPSFRGAAVVAARPPAVAWRRACRVRVFIAACCRPPPRQACPPILLDQLHTATRRFSGKTPPFLRTSNTVIDKDPHARPGYWRHRVNANRGRSEGRDARCKGLAHAGRAARGQFPLEQRAGSPEPLKERRDGGGLAARQQHAADEGAVGRKDKEVDRRATGRPSRHGPRWRAARAGSDRVGSEAVRGAKRWCSRGRSPASKSPHPDGACPTKATTLERPRRSELGGSR